MKYAVSIETTRTGFSAWVVDLPGCVAASSTLDEVRQDIKGAIEMHIKGMRDDGDPIPTPSCVEFVDIDIVQMA